MKREEDNGLFWCPVCGKKKAVWQNDYDFKELFILIAAVVAVRTLKRRRVLTMKDDLFKPYDYDAPGAPKGEPPVRDKYCIGCKHLLRCEGKPRGVKECLCYEERNDGHNRTN